MRKAFVAMGVAAVSLAAPNVSLAEPNTVTAFVGSFLDISEIECHSDETTDARTGQQLITICTDALFRATYEVEKVLEGMLETGATVTFTVADHYGFPKFAEQQRALIFLGEHEGSYYHIKYRWEPAYRTNDGEFAQCGCETEDEDESSADCRTLSFSPAVTRDLTHSSQYVIDKLSGELDYKIQGSRAECMRGILVEDVYKRLRPELMEDINAPE